MKKLLHSFLLVAVLGFCALPATLSLTSCASSSNLAAGGVYAGDATLFNADQVITGSYGVLDTFVTWEYNNRPLLVSTPAIRKAADSVRANGRQLIETSIALRDAYKVSPTADNKSKLLSGIAVLQALLNEIATYYAANLAPAPASAPKPVTP